MNTLDFEEYQHLLQNLKLLKPEGEKVNQALVEENIFIFTPKNDVEDLAIAVATLGETGWKGSLYSLDCTDTYREHTCFIFATQPKESKNQQWLLVSNDSKNDVKFWSALEGMLLRDVYYAWTSLVQKTFPSQAELSSILIQHIASTLYQCESITLKELVDIFPVKRLTEIYLYLKIACVDPRHKITNREEIILIQGDNLVSARQITMPIVTFYAEVDLSFPPKSSRKISYSEAVQRLQVKRSRILL